MRKYNITVNGQVFEVEVEEVGSAAPVNYVATPASGSLKEVKAKPVAVTPAPAPKPAAATTSGTTITSPLPGTILDVKVTVGQQVKAGDVLMVLEAMKMENEVTTFQNGTILEILVSKGQTVESGANLVIIG